MNCLRRAASGFSFSEILSLECGISAFAFTVVAIARLQEREQASRTPKSKVSVLDAGAGRPKRSIAQGLPAPHPGRRLWCATSAGDRTDRLRRRARWPGPGPLRASARAGERGACGLLWSQESRLRPSHVQG